MHTKKTRVSVTYSCAGCAEFEDVDHVVRELEARVWSREYLALNQLGLTSIAG